MHLKAIFKSLRYRLDLIIQPEILDCDNYKIKKKTYLFEVNILKSMMIICSMSIGIFLTLLFNIV